MIRACVHEASERVALDLRKGKRIRTCCLFMGYFILKMLDFSEEAELDELEFLTQITKTAEILLEAGRCSTDVPHYLLEVCMNRLWSLSQPENTSRVVAREVM